MSYETVTVNTDSRGVATLTMNRAEKHNALSAQLIADLTAAAHALREDDAVRVVVLTGNGPTVCAGGEHGTSAVDDGVDWTRRT